MQDIHEIANQLVTDSKGLLAADESTTTANKRLESVGVHADREHRRQYRNLFLATPGIGAYLSGVILFDETLWQQADDKRAFIEILKEEGVLYGVKVDEGKHPDPDSPEETVTHGLDGLADRLREYQGHGAVFAKWRAVIKIDKDMHLPTQQNIDEEAEQLAAYAKICQDEGIVPIVEPEVLLQGDHTIDTAEQITEKTLKTVFDALQAADVSLEALLLKTSMVLPGSEQQKTSPKTVAERTVRVLQKTVPESVAGIVFLSGGQEPIEATNNLQAINMLQPLPWKTSFSFARALQEPSLKAWRGEEKNIEQARELFLHRLRMNQAALRGEYEPSME